MTNKAGCSIWQSNIWQSRQALSKRRAGESRCSCTHPTPLVMLNAILTQTAACQSLQGRTPFHLLRPAELLQSLLRTSLSSSFSASSFLTSLPRLLGCDAALPDAARRRGVPTAGSAALVSTSTGEGRWPRGRGPRRWVGADRWCSWQELALPPPPQRRVQARAHTSAVVSAVRFAALAR